MRVYTLQSNQVSNRSGQVKLRTRPLVRGHRPKELWISLLRTLWATRDKGGVRKQVGGVGDASRAAIRSSVEVLGRTALEGG
mmetsp:Transcript_71968/g.192216  ORF Transcript_71968/g.192216 Transcript_71968/m.192216 type:complete len:82 (+) Transcript_71968:39-284(+)